MKYSLNSVWKTHIHPKFREVGENTGEKIFDVFREDRNSLTIQRQKRPYVDQFGKIFESTLMIYFLTLFYIVAQRIVLLSRSPNMPDSLIYDIVYYYPDFSYGLYGSGTIVAGSLFLASDIFDNFLTEDIERGRILATIHGGAILIFVGLAFQSADYYKIEVSEPMISNFAINVLYYLINHSAEIFPFITVPLVVIFVAVSYRFSQTGQDDRYTQTQITSDKWR